MAPLPWLRLFEQMAVNQLLKTPAFHRAVETVVKSAHRIRYGPSPDEMGGTQIDQTPSQFGRHFLDELKSQLGAAEKKQIAEMESSILKAATENKGDPSQTPDEGAEAAWRELQRQAGGEQKPGFMADYADALRNQVRDKKPPG